MLDSVSASIIETPTESICFSVQNFSTVQEACKILKVYEAFLAAHRGPTSY